MSHHLWKSRNTGIIGVFFATHLNETDLPMKIVDAMAAMMAMDERTWRRHANPLSVWTRLPIIAVLVAILFYRDLLGWWMWPLLAAAIVWTFFNPRAFPEPASTDNWASKGVMGERVWLNRKAVAIPPHHAAWAQGLVIASGVGMIPLIWGLVVQDFWLTAFGTLLVFVSKLWFVDRMAWLFEDMSRTTGEYAKWLR